MISTPTNPSSDTDSFFREYTSQDAILKYTKATAGFGISYLLDHDYKKVYLQALALLPVEMKRGPLRILEFGCGGGMNLLHLLTVLSRDGFNVEQAIGSESLCCSRIAAFSPSLGRRAARGATGTPYGPW